MAGAAVFAADMERAFAGAIVVQRDLVGGDHGPFGETASQRGVGYRLVDRNLAKKSGLFAGMLTGLPARTSSSAATT